MPLTIAGVVDLARLADVPVSSQLVGSAQLAMRHRVDATVARTRDLVGGIPVHGRVLTGDPAAELLQLAAGADEIVVGSHGTGQFGRLLIGSVGSRVAEHASCPAVVVRGDRMDGRVVVGIDSSPHSESALGYGFGYADTHGVPLVTLQVFTFGAFVYPVLPYPVPPYPVVEEELDRIRAEALRTAEHNLAKWTEKYPDVDVHVEAAEGSAAHELVKPAGPRGCRRRRPRARRSGRVLLGSVSHAVLRHARCPIVIAL